MEGESVQNYFSLVETLKKRGALVIKEFSVVPHKWVVDGFLFWPNSGLNKLQKDSSSEPVAEEWSKSRCIIKQSNIATFEEGLLYEEYYSTTNTEDEANVVSSVQGKIQQEAPKNYNSYFEVTSPISFTTEEDSGLITEKENQQRNITIPNQSNEVVVLSDACFMSNPPCSESCNKRYDLLNGKIERLQSQMVSQRVILQRIEDYLSKVVEPKQITELDKIGIDDEILANQFKFPINTVDELKKFNKHIESSPQYKTYISNYFSGICGTDGLQRGDKLGVKLVSDIICTKYLLTLTSWTGISRSAKCDQKFPFRSLESVIDVISTVLIKADNRWSKTETEKLLREKLLKHSNKRNKADLKKNEPKTVPQLTAGENSVENLVADSAVISNVEVCSESDHGFDVEDDK